MRLEIAIAGFGGQGVVSAGLLLARAALEENLHVSWLPSYGPEMRGGRACSQVVISDERINSPLLDRPHLAVVMSGPALARYASLVQPGGILLINTTAITDTPGRADITTGFIPAGELAQNLGLDKAANMVLLGSLFSFANPFSQLLPAAAVLQAIRHLGRAKGETIVELNCQAFQAGRDYALANPCFMAPAQVS